MLLEVGRRHFDAADIGILSFGGQRRSEPHAYVLESFGALHDETHGPNLVSHELCVGAIDLYGAVVGFVFAGAHTEQVVGVFVVAPPNLVVVGFDASRGHRRPQRGERHQHEEASFSERIQIGKDAHDSKVFNSGCFLRYLLAVPKREVRDRFAGAVMVGTLTIAQM